MKMHSGFIKKIEFSLLIAASLFILTGVFAQNKGEITIYIPKEEVVLQEAEVNEALAKVLAEAKALSKEKKSEEALALLRPHLKTAIGEELGEVVSSMGYAKIKAKNYGYAESYYMSIAKERVPSSEATYAEAWYRLGYLEILRKNREAAIRNFTPVANGTVKTSIDDATDAALRIGALLRLQRRADEAITVYEQIGKKAPKSKDRLYAKLQASGLLWETGKGDYKAIETKEEKFAYFEQSKVLAKEIMDDPEVKKGTLLIAELLYLENFYFQQDFETTLDLASEYAAKWIQYATTESEKEKVNTYRQILTAQTWLCFAQYRIGDYTDCIETCHMIRSDAWEKNDPYGNFNVFGYSMIYEAFSQEALGGHVEGKRLRDLAKETYPDWYNAVIESVERKLGIWKEKPSV